MELVTIYKASMSLLVLQLLIILVPLYLNLKAARAEKSKRMLFLAFLLYMLFITFHIQEYAAFASFVQKPFFFAIVLDHLFKALFFLVYGYTIVNVYISDIMLKKINYANFVFASLFLISYTALLMGEGEKLVFVGTAKEVVYSTITLIISFLIMNMLYHSWREIRSPHLLVNTFAFAFFFIAEIGHTAADLWGFSKVEFLTRHVFRTLALFLITYSVLRYRK